MKNVAALVTLLAGLSTGYQVARQIMWAIWGAPVIWTEYVGLAGSICLVVAAGMKIFKHALFLATSVVGNFALWAFYGPALWATAQTPTLFADPVVFLPALFLTASTLVVIPLATSRMYS